MALPAQGNILRTGIYELFWVEIALYWDWMYNFLIWGKLTLVSGGCAMCILSGLSFSPALQAAEAFL